MKGAKDAGVKKHKKKKPKPESCESKATTKDKEQDPEEMTALQKALAEEERDGSSTGKQLSNVDKDLGKTEAQRKHEEIRRKRVCSFMMFHVAGPLRLEHTLTWDCSSTIVSNAKA